MGDPRIFQIFVAPRLVLSRSTSAGLQSSRGASILAELCRASINLKAAQAGNEDYAPESDLIVGRDQGPEIVMLISGPAGSGAAFVYGALASIWMTIGPLANPAGADYQLLGVGRAELLDPLAGALAKLGTKQAYLVCGRDGLDEVTLAAPTMFRQVCGNKVMSGEWTAADFGLEP